MIMAHTHKYPIHDGNNSSSTRIDEEQPLLPESSAASHDQADGKSVPMRELWKSCPALSLGYVPTVQSPKTNSLNVCLSIILFGADYALATASCPKIGGFNATLSDQYPHNTDAV